VYAGHLNASIEIGDVDRGEADGPGGRLIGQFATVSAKGWFCPSTPISGQSSLYRFQGFSFSSSSSGLTFHRSASSMSSISRSICRNIFSCSGANRRYMATVAW